MNIMTPDNYEFALHTWAMLGTFPVALIIAIILFHRRSVPSALYLSLMEFAVAIWALFAFFESASTTVPLKLFWSKVAYLGTPPSPILFFLFALAYTKNFKFLTAKSIIMFSVIPVVTIILAFTNDWHHLIWTNVEINPETNISLYSHGAFFYIYLVYSYILLVVGIGLLVKAVRKNPTYYFPHLKLILAAAAFPVTANIIYILNMNPLNGFDWTPVSFVVTGLILGIGLYRYHLFEIMPIARKKIIDTMNDGVLVLDLKNRINDLNPAMGKILGTYQQSIGLPIDTVLGQWMDIFEHLKKHQHHFFQVSIDINKEKRYFDIGYSELKITKKAIAGHLFVFRDITEQKNIETERENLIDELQHALQKVKTLSGLLPICAHCKKIRDDHGYWTHVEEYLREHSSAEFSHGLCPHCVEELYPGYYKAKNATKN